MKSNCGLNSLKILLILQLVFKQPLYLKLVSYLHYWHGAGLLILWCFFQVFISRTIVKLSSLFTSKVLASLDTSLVMETWFQIYWDDVDYIHVINKVL